MYWNVVDYDPDDRAADRTLTRVVLKLSDYSFIIDFSFDRTLTRVVLKPGKWTQYTVVKAIEP